MAWRVARSLDVLLGQLDRAFPSRSKISDGGIGDTSHQAEGWTASDHNPWYPLPAGGIVTARDYTHDPEHGVDIGRLSDDLAASRDPRIKYIIANGLILDSRPQFQPWRWVKYTGSNAHDHHLHLSVMDSPLCDDPRPWDLPMLRGEDMNDAQNAALFDIRAQMAGTPELGKYPGWPAHADTSSAPKTLVDYVRALHAEQQAQRQVLDSILTKLGGAK